MGTHSKFLLVVELEKDEDPYTEVIDIQAPLWEHNNDPYPLWAMICAKCINIIATFTFNYMYVFDTIISIGLSTLFKLFNAEIIRAKSEVLSF